MNANVSESGSLMGKMAAIFVVVLFVFSSFSLLASADSGDEQETELSSGITLGEALVPSDEGVEVISELNTIYPCLLYTSPSPRDLSTSRMPSSA